jgi:pyridoxal 5'-phosphate synthase pdxT subunit
MVIGILAVQGAFIEHIHMFERLQIEAVEIRLPGELKKVQGLIIPGGESTTMMNLMQSFDLIQPLKRLAEARFPIWGTCAGMICVSKNVQNPDSTRMETLGLMDIAVRRNAFGRQVDSFEAALHIDTLKDGPFPGIFIRAPYIESTGAGVDVLAVLPNGEIVAARQGNLLVTSFHPELTDDVRVHRYFARMCGK